MSLNSTLRDLGLHKTESLIYLYLLRNGSSTVINVSHGTKIARSNCYYVIHSLISKGLISRQHAGGKIIYTANDPTAIGTYLETKLNLAKQSMQDLEAAFFRSNLKPQVTFYDKYEDISSFLISLISNKVTISLFGPKPGDPEVLQKFISNVESIKMNQYLKITTTRKSMNGYLLMWPGYLAFVPISSIPFMTVIRNDDMQRSISALTV